MTDRDIQTGCTDSQTETYRQAAQTARQRHTDRLHRQPDRDIQTGCTDRQPETEYAHRQIEADCTYAHRSFSVALSIHRDFPKSKS